MSMMRKLFRPITGASDNKRVDVHSGFVTAYLSFGDDTVATQSDWVIWDSLIPTSQGASGVLEGVTLDTTDTIFVRVSDATAATNGNKWAGVITGGLDTNDVYQGGTESRVFNDRTVSMTEDTLVIICNSGFARGRSDTGATVGEQLITSAVDGEMAGETNLTAGTLDGEVGGVCFQAAAAFTRIAASEHDCISLVKASF